MLWLALRFPNLPLEALGCKYSDNRLLLVDDQQRVCAATKATLDNGIQIGMKTSASHALAEVQVCPRNPASETQLLQNLAAWGYQFTPYIQRYGDDCLLLEVSRCLRLFGGIERFCKKLCEALNHKTLDYQIGLAHSRQGAWLLSHEQYSVCADDSQAIFMERIESMPLSYLNEFPDVAEKLNSMGFHSFADLLKLPSADLGKRFGQEFINWLRDLQGKELVVLPKSEPKEYFQCSINFAYAVNNTQFLEAPATHLLQELVDFLIEHQLETRQIDWYLYSEKGQVHSFSLGAERIHGQKQLLLELTQIRLEQLRLIFSIERMELRCEQTSAVEILSLQLFEEDVAVQIQGQSQSQTQTKTQGNQSIQEAAETLSARLQTQLGQESIYQLDPQEQLLPEQQSARVLPFKAASEASSLTSFAQGPRPVWLFQRPQKIGRNGGQLYWNNRGEQQGNLQLIQGPERIQGQWWTEQDWQNPSVRDYFIAEREDHVRYWVYHDWQNDHWYAQGVFA